MGELAIRRDRVFFVPRPAQSVKTEKTAGAGSSQRVSKTGLTVSDALQKLMAQVSQAENSARGSRRTLQTGEGTLAAVQDQMDRIKELVQKAAGADTSDRAALQAELESLRSQIDRMLGSAVSEGTHLFLDEDMDVENGLAALLQAVVDDLSAGPEGIRELPSWFLRGLAGDGLSPEELLAGLGLDKTASPAEIMAAIANSPPDSTAAARLALLYLGAAIAGGGSNVTPEEMVEGLRLLLERVSEGLSPDEALKELTGGTFSSLGEFWEQFTAGTVPGLQSFLTDLLLGEGGSLAAAGAGGSLLSLLAGMEGADLDLLMGLLTTLQSAGADQTGQDLGTAADAGTAQTAGADTSPQPRMAVLQAGPLQVMGRDLSGVSFQAETGTLTLAGTGDVVLLGTGQELKTILIAGSGRVTLQNVTAGQLIADATSATLISVGKNTLGELQLREGVSLTLDGGGQLRLDSGRAGLTSLLRLAGGAVLVPGKDPGTPGTLNIPVLMEGPASLAARAVSVNSPEGRTAQPFDIIWKTMLPGWSQISSIEVNGKLVKMGLSSPDLARLWLDKGDPSHGHPIYTLIIRGRDKLSRPAARYAYLFWDQSKRTFQETVMFPDPFTVTGGEEGRDWIYEDASQTLYILSGQVTGLSGGMGTDAAQTLFSGRIVLADRIGKTELVLGGVTCRVSSGRAFDLGRENDVTLILESGTRNRFESGAGYAGISLGSGTSLSIDRAGGAPDGSLTASGGEGGAGIGRDSGGGRDQASHILIRGGSIAAAGTGGGAGIGAGKHGAIGTITVLDGTVTSTGGKGGGAGIGGALGAPAGDISIRGGTISAEAVQHAAAIGAGVQGACGDIQIGGTARIVKAQGGNPGADIGACLFGTCGKVSVSGSANIGDAKLWTSMGIPLRIGAETVMLPQFHLSSRVLRLDQMDVTTQQSAQAAGKTVDTYRRWVAQIQGVYTALHDQLEQRLLASYGAQPYIGAAENALRDSIAATDLLRDMEQTIQIRAAQAMSAHSRQGARDVRQLLW